MTGGSLLTLIVRMCKGGHVLMLPRGVALTVDPLYFLSISIDGAQPCINMGDGVAVVATVIRICIDLVHICHVLMSFSFGVRVKWKNLFNMMIEKMPHKNWIVVKLKYGLKMKFLICKNEVGPILITECE